MLAVCALLTALGYWTYHAVETSLREIRAGNMRSLLDSEVNALRVWIAEELGDAERIARDPRVAEAIVALVRAPACAGPARERVERVLQPALREVGDSTFNITGRDGRLIATRYPDYCGRRLNAERALLTGTDRRDLLATLEPCMSPAELVELQAGVQRVHVAPALLDYVQAIVEHTRRSPDYVAGLSPRAALALVHSARAWALLEGRDKVIPEDVQAILPGVAAHRLRPAHDTARRVDVGAQLLAAVPIPQRATMHCKAAQALHCNANVRKNDDEHRSS